MRKKLALEVLYPLFIKARLFGQYLCGDCRKLFSRPLRTFKVRNTIYYGPSGCLEMKKISKVKLCHRCLQRAERKGDLRK